MSLINLYNFSPRSHANGPGERAVAWVQGCPRSCLGCFNPDTQKSVIKNLISVDELESQILAIDGIDGITFSGGEPFAQAKILAELAKRLRKCELTVVCYTGYTLEQLQDENHEDWNALLSEVDLLIDGPFMQAELCHESYRGSANQKLYFFSNRIKLEEVLGQSQLTELMLDTDGKIQQTGFPDFYGVDITMKEISKILKDVEG